MSTETPALNIPLIRRVQAALHTAPETYDQSTYCGSACCIGGHTVSLHHAGQLVRDVGAHPRWGVAHNGYITWLPEVDDLGAYAASLLGLPREFAQKHCLFGFGTGWPEPFRRRLAWAETAQEKAQVAIDLLDWVIEQLDEPARPSVTLTLTAEDADALWTVTRNVGGEPAGPRGAFDRIAVALRVAYGEDLNVLPVRRRTESLYFE